MSSIVASPEHLLFLVLTTPRKGGIVIFILQMRILRFGVRLTHPRSLQHSSQFKPELRFSFPHLGCSGAVMSDVQGLLKVLGKATFS